MPTFSVSKGAAKAAKSDVLAVPVFEGLKLGPGAKEAQDVLGSTVKELSEHVPVLGKPSKQFTGELGDAILVQTLGKLPAKQVLFVGMSNHPCVRRAHHVYTTPTQGRHQTLTHRILIQVETYPHGRFFERKCSFSMRSASASSFAMSVSISSWLAW